MKPLLAACAFLAVLISTNTVYSSENGSDFQRARALIQNKQYADAASLLNTKDIASRPEKLMLFTRLLVDNYVVTLNFELFGLKNLQEGQTVAELRGKPGESQMLGGSLPETLKAALDKNPDSPEVNFAVGYYLAKGNECGCGQKRIFTGEAGVPGPYFVKAMNGGIEDAYSLFQIAMYYSQQTPPRVGEAVALYERSLKLEPERTAARFNLAALQLYSNGLEKAEKNARLAVDGYDNPELNADTHTLLGNILEVQEKKEAAEVEYRKALELQNWNASAFTYLIRLLRSEERNDAYVKAVLDYIAIEYHNSYLFNAYVNFLGSHGFKPIDDIVEERLAELDLDAAAAGAVYFNLGRMADFKDQPELALARYKRSLGAFQSLENAPTGAIPVLERRIKELER